MLKLRLEGLPEEVEKGVQQLEQVYHVLSVSRAYKNRGNQYVRIYVEAELKDFREK